LLYFAAKASLICSRVDFSSATVGKTVGADVGIIVGPSVGTGVGVAPASGLKEGMPDLVKNQTPAPPIRVLMIIKISAIKAYFQFILKFTPFPSIPIDYKLMAFSLQILA
jgi:hypothetical protein